MSKLDLFKKQQALRSRLSYDKCLHVVPPRDKVDMMLNVKVDTARLSSFDYIGDLSLPIESDPVAAQALLNELQNSFNNKKLDALLNKAQSDLIQSIVGPLGIGKLVSAYDKVGGNVDTIHNARNNIYATQEAHQAYEERGEYNKNVSDAAHKHENYKAQNERHTINKETVGAEDVYTKERIYSDQKMDLDHVVSAKNTHDDRGRVLAGINTENLANIDENLTPTTASINRSKKQKSPEEFASYLENTAVARKEKITELSQKEFLTDKEKNEFRKLKQLDSVDPDAVRAKGKLAQDAQDKLINETYYYGDQFRKDLLHSGVNEGVKMGAQQAVGVLLVELFTASMDEIKDAFKNGKQGGGLIEDIKIRLGRISKRVALKWKDAIEGFGAGLISGFISTIVTTIINIFVTTGKRLVRMIREGFFSLLKALKVMLFPPDGLTYTQAAHEGMKLIASGGLIIGGIALEEIIEKWLVVNIPFLSPIVSLLTTIIVGAITGISMALVCYLIDKMDLLGVVKIERDMFIIKALDETIDASLERCELLANEADNYFGEQLLLGG